MKLFIRTILFFILLSGFTFSLMANDTEDDPLNQTVYIRGGKHTVYSLLNSVSESSGYMFIYDSKLINNDSKIKIPAGRRTIREALNEILNDSSLDYIVEGNHLLICGHSDSRQSLFPSDGINPSDSRKYNTVRGVILDKKSSKPIEFSNIYIKNHSVATISNLNGEFALKIPDSLSSGQINISYLGYKTKQIPISLLIGRYIPIYLEEEIYTLEESVIKYIDPIEQVKKILDNKNTNYSETPAILTTFYREGVEYNKKLSSLTEAICQVYKSSSMKSAVKDQVKLLKKSIIKNKNGQDTLSAKILAEIDACLSLDIVKQVPPYLTVLKRDNPYKYTYGGSVFNDSVKINIVNFEPTEIDLEHIFKGSLFIEDQSGALIKAIVELQSDFIDSATGLYVAKQGKKIKITPSKICYTISYRKWQGKYYINHVRGDLTFKVRKQRQILGNYLLHTWFEMVTCKIETEGVERFSNPELISTRSIFSEDPIKNENQNYWGEFNTIPWEGSLIQNINAISTEVEQLIVE